MPRLCGYRARCTVAVQPRCSEFRFSAFADFFHARVRSSLIRERTGEGRKRALANGVKFGRKPKLSGFQRCEALKRRVAGDHLADIAKSYAVDITTYRGCRAPVRRFGGDPNPTTGAKESSGEGRPLGVDGSQAVD